MIFRSLVLEEFDPQTETVYVLSSFFITFVSVLCVGSVISHFGIMLLWFEFCFVFICFPCFLLLSSLTCGFFVFWILSFSYSSVFASSFCFF